MSHEMFGNAAGAALNTFYNAAVTRTSFGTPDAPRMSASARRLAMSAPAFPDNRVKRYATVMGLRFRELDKNELRELNEERRPIIPHYLVELQREYKMLKRVRALDARLRVPAFRMKAPRHIQDDILKRRDQAAVQLKEVQQRLTALMPRESLPSKVSAMRMLREALGLPEENLSTASEVPIREYRTIKREMQYSGFAIWWEEADTPRSADSSVDVATSLSEWRSVIAG